MLNHHITPAAAIELTNRYRTNHPADFFICETYEASAIQELLNVTGCHFLRIYLGRKADNSVVTVLVAADGENADILPSLATDVVTPATASGGTAVILEDGYRCPEACPPKSPLNS